MQGQTRWRWFLILLPQRNRNRGSASPNTDSDGFAPRRIENARHSHSGLQGLSINTCRRARPHRHDQFFVSYSASQVHWCLSIVIIIRDLWYSTSSSLLTVLDRSTWKLFIGLATPVSPAAFPISGKRCSMISRLVCLSRIRQPPGTLSETEKFEGPPQSFFYHLGICVANLVVLLSQLPKLPLKVLVDPVQIS